MRVERLIRQRRSVRRYTTQVPRNTDVRKIIQSAVWAPSGLNNQPWKFKLIKEKDKKQELAKFTKYGRIIQEAPLVICVFLDNGATYNREKDIMAIGACIQNMLLQAYDLGLRSCWLGEILNNRQQVEDYLAIDSDLELMAVICLGYSDHSDGKSSRKKLDSFLLK